MLFTDEKLSCSTSIYTSIYTIELPGLFRMMMIMYDVVIKKLKSFFALNFRMILNGNMICTKNSQDEISKLFKFPHSRKVRMKTLSRYHITNCSSFNIFCKKLK